MPAFVHTKVDPDRLSSAAGNIEDCLKLIYNALGAVDDSLNSSLRPSWSGSASAQFFAQYSVDVEGFNSLMAELSDYNDKLRQAAGQYDNADNDAGDQINRMKIAGADTSPLKGW
jgi:WXG100 family type VII secretion target